MFLLGMEKYRVHEVAKDFGLPTKTITEILTKYVAAPKNHMQVLDDHELSVIFDYLTQHNQVSSIQAIFADTYQAKSAPAQADAPADAHKSAAPAEKQPAQAAEVRKNADTPAKQPADTQKAAAPVQQPSTRVPQKKIVDTRKGGDVNLAKYDERLETLGGERAERMQQKGGKEKFRNSNQRRGNMTFSNKRKQDEAQEPLEEDMEAILIQ